MEIENIIKKKDGSRVKICCRLIDLRTRIEYRVRVYTKGKGKRKWFDVLDTDDYRYRRLDTEGRQQWGKDKQLEVVTEDEIYETKLMLWESIKPKK